MGRVAIMLKVYLESPEVEEKVKQALMEQVKPTQIISVPVFGGLNALKVAVVRDDKEGAGDIEERIKKIAGVSEVQTEDVTLIS